ncbi:T9SS type A sorting domain-containing protein [Flavobacterium sp. EDS]|uniref:T9SS type A sorting domain-containing protein n=1 Tax=Flavobacterium sp. EDS TaxID=2897328 RepID=UPI001E565C7F|nr:T9SS type A sorting domain-containing protein [Flavobacterium sp. EDS]MCD0473276.1 T9SS type A sorting domain-containing protein [Flavobacterium sp. EDS]
MKYYLSLVLLGFVMTINSQTKITFNYDAAGNQTLRELCLLGCTAKMSKEIPKEIEAITEEDLQKFSPEDVISYYPNPVREELYLKWELKDGNSVSSIVVYGLNGQTLSTYHKAEKINTQNISFQSYPTGIYIVALIYTSGDQKTIKIIKQ